MSLIANLRALHLVDSQVRGIRTRLGNTESELRRHQVQVDKLAGERRELETQLRQLQAAVANLELEDKGFQERLNHIRTELNNSSNSRQYNALRDELKVIEGKRDALAERILAQMENVEKVKGQLAVNAGPLGDRTKLRDMAKAALEEARSEFGGRLAELEAQRERAAALLPAEAREAFDEAAEQNEGEALAEVQAVSVRHREYACGGCNAELPLDAFSRVTSPREDVVTCLTCGRILWMEKLPQPEKTAKQKAKDPDHVDG